MLFKRLYINYDVIDYPLTKLISSKLKIPIRIVYDQLAFLRRIKKSKNSIKFGKKNLYLTKNKGNFIKKCPGTQKYVCCGYFILHIGSFCYMDCSYCILQTYFHPPLNQFFVNCYDLEKELTLFFKKDNISRIGTGEFTDSLIWDKWTGISEILIKKFSCQNRSVLELKTKTANVANFKNLIHNRKTILSWSLNTARLISTEEKFTNSLDSRLEAASKCSKWGYPIAFHFDPLIIYDGCKRDYELVIEKIFNSVSPDDIVWISIGSFRFIPSLKPIIMKRFSDSKIIYGEFVKGLDGKMRYFRLIRIDLYKHIVKCIQKISSDICIYFCMEDHEIWKEVMGLNMYNTQKLSGILDSVAAQKCGLVKKI